ncbi:uncharacterized protein LOC133193370 isoform X1 [Saccostrea echinata]|uniref:uncharacterized protein LOC133193370 isoform X1 n=1 Tax=Saccostrea echinata TaxID=191078 RepID=UPI002A8411BC|nr:uncharacterized protein LOC133193370 isoform X1 [Saccostrea echinata]XP_061185290.1 uncharacterized protein LOC133193370 isoform X1 [Saccostrea echinata]
MGNQKFSTLGLVFCLISFTIYIQGTVAQGCTTSDVLSCSNTYTNAYRAAGNDHGKICRTSYPSSERDWKGFQSTVKMMLASKNATLRLGCSSCHLCNRHLRPLKPLFIRAANKALNCLDNVLAACGTGSSSVDSARQYVDNVRQALNQYACGVVGLFFNLSVMALGLAFTYAFKKFND